MPALVCVLFLVLMAAPGVHAVPLEPPRLTQGDAWDVEEGFRLNLPSLGPGGNIAFDSTLTYTMTNETTITHEASGSIDSFDVYHLTGVGRSVGSGEVSLPSLEGTVSVADGIIESSMYFERTTFATVKRTRTISGQASYEGPGGFQIPIGMLRIEFSEEYLPPFGEVPFPLEGGVTDGDQSTVTFFGEVVLAGRPPAPFNVNVPFPSLYTVTAWSRTIGGQSLPSFITNHTFPPSTISLDTEYACAAGMMVHYELRQLPLSGAGSLDYLTSTVTGFDIAADPCEAAPPGDPALSIDSLAANYQPNAPVAWSFGIDNSGNPNTFDAQVWLVLDILGSFYFFNYEDGQFAENPLVTSTPALVPAQAPFERTFLDIPEGFEPLGGLFLTWYLGVQRSDGTFLDDFPSVSTFHE